MELLKQKQYSPVAVEKQVAIIYAGTKGHLDEIPKDRIIEFEEKFYDYLDASCSDVMQKIKNSGQITDEIEESLKNKINDFVKGF